MRRLFGLTVSTGIIVLAVLLGALWLIGSWSSQRQQLAAYSQLSQQTQLLSSNLQQTVGILKSSLELTYRTAREQIAESASLQIGSEVSSASRPRINSKVFSAVGLVSKNSDKKWRANWVVKGVNAKGESPATVSVKSLNGALKGFSLKSLKKGQVFFERISVGKSKYLAVLLGPSQQSRYGEVVVGFVPMDYIARLSYLQQTPELGVYVFAGKSLALTHPKARYIGARETAHPLVRRLKSSDQVVSQFKYKANDGQGRDAVSERVANTNLNVVIEQKAAPGLISSLGFLQWLLFSVLWVALSICGAMILQKLFTLEYRNTSYLKKSIMALSKKQALPVAPKTMTTDKNLKKVLDDLHTEVVAPIQNLTPLTEQASSDQSPMEEKVKKLDAIVESEVGAEVLVTNQNLEIQTFANELIRRVKAPTFSIQGYVELAKVRPDDESLDENLKKISSEAKKIKSVVQDLLLFTNESKADVEVFVMENCLLELIKSESKELELRGYQLRKKLSETHHVKGSLLYFEKAFVSIANFLKSNASGSTREFLVTASSTDEEVEMKVMTSIYSGSLDQALEQDYDLMVAQGAMRAQGGDLRIECNAQFNLQFCLTLPKASESEIWQANLEEEKVKEEVLQVLEENVEQAPVEEPVEAAEEFVAETDDDIQELVEDTFKLAGLVEQQEEAPGDEVQAAFDDDETVEYDLRAEESGPTWSIEDVETEEEVPFVQEEAVQTAKIKVPRPKVRV